MAFAFAGIFAANAQVWVGGGLGAKITDENTRLTVSPEIGYAFNNHWQLALGAGYTFDKTRVFRSLRLALGLQNVFTITKYPGLDPEVYGGMDSSSTPRPRMVMLSVSAEF